MALTTGKKITGVTGSSIAQQASRRGVVPASDADWVSMAAEQIGATLDAEAKRKAVIEENDYKSRFTIQTIKTIDQFEKDHYDDPDGFTNVADAYIARVESEAPFRFKAYAKEYASLLAHKSAKAVHKEHEAKKFNESANLKIQSSEAAYTSIKNHLNNISSSEWDNEFETLILAQLTEEIGSYKEYYYAHNSSQQATLNQSALGHPIQFENELRKKLEIDRIGIWRRDYYNLARTKDLEATLGIDINGDNEIAERQIEHEGLTHLQVAQMEFNSMLTEYRKNPEAVFGGEWTLLDSDDTQRADIIDESLTRSDADIATGERENAKHAAKTEVEYQQKINQMKDFLESGEGNDYIDRMVFDLKYPNINALETFFYDTNATVEDRKIITDLYNVKNIIEETTKYLSAEGDERRTIKVGNIEKSLPLTNNIWTDVVGEAKRQMGEMGVAKKLSSEEIEKRMINQMFFNATGQNISEASFSLPVILNEEVNPAMKFMGNFVKRYGKVPEQFSNYLSTFKSLDFESPDDLDIAINMAHAISFINKNNNWKDHNISGLSADTTILLEQFWEQYNQRNIILDEKIKAFGQDAAVKEEGYLPLKQFAKNWFQTHNERDDERVDIINKSIKNKIIDLNISDKLEEGVIDQLKKNNTNIIDWIQEHSFGYDHGALSGEARMKPLIDVWWLKNLIIIPDESAIEREEKIASLIVKDLIPGYLLHHYNATLPGTQKGKIGNANLELIINDITEEQFTKDFTKIIKWVIDDMEHMGFGIEQ